MRIRTALLPQYPRLWKHRLQKHRKVPASPCPAPSEDKQPRVTRGTHNYGCVTNHYKFRDLKQHKSLILRSCRSEVHMGAAGSSAPGLTLKAKGPICFQAYSGCWRNSVPRSCGTEVSVSWLAVDRGHSQNLGSPVCLGSWPCQSRHCWVAFFSGFKAL